MNQSKDISDKVNKVKNFLNVLNGKFLSIGYDSISSFENKESYPLDFQIFMEQIGEISVSSEPKWNGYSVLHVISPAHLKKMKKNKFDDPYNYFWEYEDRQEKDYYSSNFLLNDVNFVAIEPCFYHAYGYVIEENESVFVQELSNSHIFEKVEMKFINWFTTCLITHVEDSIESKYTSCSAEILKMDEYKTLKELMKI